MQNLLIEQKGPNGLMKTWKLRSEQKLLTFGHSKHADLRTSIESVKGIQGVFEFKNDKWYYINLDLHTKHSEIPEGKVEFCIDKDCELRMGTNILSIRVLEGKSPLFSRLEGEVAEAGQGTHPFQLFTVYSGSTLLETTLIPFEKKFSSKHDLSKTSFTPVHSIEWQKNQVGHLEVSQRTVHLKNADALKHLSSKDLIDQDAKRSLQFVGVTAFLFLMLFIFSPKKNILEESLTPPPLQAREVKIEIPKKKKAARAEKKTEETAPAPKQVAAEQTPTPAAAPKGGDGGSRAASLIKNLASGRITSLVGKVASSAKSANVVVTSGVSASSPNTGRALAAVGSISKSGKDWSAEGKGSGITISTNGKAGGQGTAGMGAIGEGKTGSGGVGLIEDEGEIVGGLDREVIAQYIRSQLGQILYCYERQLSANPDLYGKVAIKFTIDGGGGVETQRIGNSTLRNETVEGCILQKVSRWKFPAPQGGTKVLVTYPFLFKSTN
jgi:TonB family protein